MKTSLARFVAAMCLASAACDSSEVEPLHNPMPILVGIDPPTVTRGAAASIAIVGLGFVEGSQARWNGDPRPTTVEDDAHLVVSLSADDLLAPAAEIDVVTPPPGGGASESATLLVTSPAPTLSTVSPASAPAIVTEGLQIEAAGTGFVSGPGGSVLHWDGAPLSTTVSSPTTLSAVVPDYLLRVGRIVAITVRNAPGSESAAKTFSVQNPAPSVVGLFPAGFPLGSGGELEVTGTGFVFGTSVLIETTRLSPTQVTTSRLVVDVPAALAGDAGSVSLSVENPVPGGGTSNLVTLSIWSTPPSVDLLMPAQTLTGGPDLSLAITGEGFEAGASLTWNGEPRTIDVVNTRRIELTVPAADLASPDTARLVITNPFDGAQAVALFPILAASAFTDILVMEPWGLPGEIVISHLDGTQSHTFAAAGGATRVDASPTGPFAVYYDNGSRLHQIDLISGTSHRVTPPSVEATLWGESWPRYAPDGVWVYFTGETASGTQIWRARTDGSATEMVTDDAPAWLRYPSPSRDGSRVVYARDTGPGFGAAPLWVLDLATSTSNPLGVEALTSRWSPLDAWIVYLTQTWDLRAVHPDGSGDFALVTDTDVGHGFDFSPDGTFLVATTQTGDPIRIEFPSGQVSPLPGLPRIGSIAWIGP